MISKVLQSGSFTHTGRYICEKNGMEIIMAEGVRAHDWHLMVQDFEVQAQLNPQKHKACFHAILSFYPGENPSNEKMAEIAGKYLQELKITDTQVAVVKHTDRAHLHLHIMANMVNNQGQSIKDNWIGLRAKKIAQRLTLEYKLIPALKKNLALTHLESLNELQATKYKIYEAIRQQLPQCKTMEQLKAKLEQQGIGIQFKLKSGTQEQQGISFKMGDYCFKGSQVDRAFSIKNLEKSLSLQQKPEQLLAKEERKPSQSMSLQEWRKLKNEQLDKGPAGEKLLKELATSAGNFLSPDENQQPLNPELLAEEQKRRRKLRHRH